MFGLTSYEVPHRKLRLLSGDSETNLELGLFDFAFSLSSTRRRSVPQLEGVRKRMAARSQVRSHTSHRHLVARQTGFISVNTLVHFGKGWGSFNTSKVGTLCSNCDGGKTCFPRGRSSESEGRCDRCRLETSYCSCLRAALCLSRGWHHCHAAKRTPRSAIIRSAKCCTSPLDPLRASTSEQLSSSRWTCS
jgi:hypothetical protein